MRSPDRHNAAFRLGFYLAILGLLTFLLGGLGCRRKPAPSTTSGAIYYTGPMKGKGSR